MPRYAYNTVTREVWQVLDGPHAFFRFFCPRLVTAIKVAPDARGAASSWLVLGGQWIQFTFDKGVAQSAPSGIDPHSWTRICLYLEKLAPTSYTHARLMGPISGIPLMHAARHQWRIMFRADTRPLGSLQLAGGFKPWDRAEPLFNVQNTGLDAIPTSGVCVSVRPEVAALFPMEFGSLTRNNYLYVVLVHDYQSTNRYQKILHADEPGNQKAARVAASGEKICTEIPFDQILWGYSLSQRRGPGPHTEELTTTISRRPTASPGDPLVNGSSSFVARPGFPKVFTEADAFVAGKLRRPFRYIDDVVGTDDRNTTRARRHEWARALTT